MEYTHLEICTYYMFEQAKYMYMRESDGSNLFQIHCCLSAVQLHPTMMHCALQQQLAQQADRHYQSVVCDGHV